MLKSKFTLSQLLYAANRKKWPYEDGITVEVYYVAPLTDIRVLDSAYLPTKSGGSTQDSERLFVMLEYAGEQPKVVRRGRSYRKVFSGLRKYPEGIVVTMESGSYQMVPTSVILSSFRAGDGDGPLAVHYRMYVCTLENLTGLPAYKMEDLDVLLEEDVKELPTGDDIVDRLRERELVGV